MFTIPGGQVHIVRNGEEMQVEVEMTEDIDNVWVEEGVASGTTVIQKQIIVTSDED